MGRNRKQGKPSGQLDSVTVGAGWARHQSKGWPREKGAIELAVLRLAVSLANLYDLTEPPQQNPENDFDFTLTTRRGDEHVDLMEVTLHLDEAPYDQTPTTYNVSEMSKEVLGGILEKSKHYGRVTQPLHLLLYSTDSRFSLPPRVVEAIAAGLAQGKHIFSTVNYIQPDGQNGGMVSPVFPRPLQAQLASAGAFDCKAVEALHCSEPRSVIFADLRRPELQVHGDTVLPMSLPLDEQAVVIASDFECYASEMVAGGMRLQRSGSIGSTETNVLWLQVWAGLPTPRIRTACVPRA